MKIKRFGRTKYKLRTLDFPENISGENLCFLTKRSLYLLVWDGEREASDLEDWLNCLISYAIHSVIMVVDVCPDKTNKSKKNLKDYLDDFEAAKELNYGLWGRSRQTEHWFTSLDVDNENGIRNLKRIKTTKDII